MCIVLGSDLTLGGRRRVAKSLDHSPAARPAKNSYL